MALKATIHKAELQVSDLDRHYYATHALTLARHPSENDERLMVRLLAFALHADPELTFTKGLSEDEEPEIWRKDLTGAIELWIELGNPELKRLRRACGRARRVLLVSYGGQGANLWWRQGAKEMEGLDNLRVIHIPLDAVKRIAALADRNMRLNCTIQEGQAWLADEERSELVEPEVWKDYAV